MKRKQKRSPRWNALKPLADGAMACAILGAQINDLSVTKLAADTLCKLTELVAEYPTGKEMIQAGKKK